MKVLFAIYLLSISANTFGGPQNPSSDCDSFKYSSFLDDKKIEIFDGILTKLSPPQEKLVSLKIKPSSSNIQWEDKYTDYLYKTLSGPSFDPLLDQKIDEDDLKKINCPQFNELDKDQKKKFYIVYLAAIAEASSDYNTNDETYSRFDKTTNYGLLQIDPESAKRHAGSIVINDIGKDELTNYVPNLQVGAYILKHQIAGKIATGRLFPDKTYYWPTLKNSQKRILNTFKSNSENLPFCKAIESTPETPALQADRPVTTNKALASVPPKSLTTLPSSELAKDPTVAPDPTSMRTPEKSANKRTPSKPIKEKRKPASPVIANSPKVSSPNGYPVKDKDGLNQQAFVAYLESLKTHPEIEYNDDGTIRMTYCAKGVRKALNKLFGGGPSNGPNALGYDEEMLSKWKKGNKCFKKSDNTNKSENYDIRISKTKSGSANPYGHAEIYFEGNWYSYIQQGISYSNNSDYASVDTFRFSTCSKTTANIQYLIHLIGSNLIAESYAETSGSTLISSETTPLTFDDVLLSQSKEWSIKKVAVGTGVKYVLFKGNKFIAETTSSVYILIDTINDETLKKSLAKDALLKWIQIDGRAAVQKRVLQFEVMTKLQKEVLINSGFEIPANISLFKK
jgi:hypothetical protein